MDKTTRRRFRNNAALFVGGLATAVGAIVGFGVNNVDAGSTANKASIQSYSVVSDTEHATLQDVRGAGNLTPKKGSTSNV